MSKRRVIATLALVAFAFTGAAYAQGTATGQKPFEPQVGQAGKDVVWVPTPQAVVDKMLDMAKVTKADVVYDLGSGDGRTVITAAKRGARRWPARSSRARRACSRTSPRGISTARTPRRCLT